MRANGLLTVLLLLVATPVRADQCAWVSERQAQAAVRALSGAKSFLAFCEPCEDETPTLIEIRSVRTQPVEDGYHEVLVNDESIDLAYAFVRSPQGVNRYENLSKIVACPSSDVSRFITWPKSGSDVPVNDWTGTYANDSILWNLSKVTKGPEHDIRLSVSQQDRALAEFSSRAELQGGVLVMTLPIPKCTIALKLVGSTLKASPRGQCGSFGASVSGTFPRR